jgi:hypothetical protein
MIELNGRRALPQQKQENVFLVQAKSAAEVMISSGVKKTVLAKRSQKTQSFQCA